MHRLTWLLLLLGCGYAVGPRPDVTCRGAILNVVESPSVDCAAFTAQETRSLEAISPHADTSQLRGWIVVVRAVDSWQVAGVQVSGRAWCDFGVLEIGSNLAALTHEMIHAGECQTREGPDYAHAGWGDWKFHAVDEAVQ